MFMGRTLVRCDNEMYATRHFLGLSHMKHVARDKQVSVQVRGGAADTGSVFLTLASVFITKNLMTSATSTCMTPLFHPEIFVFF